MRLLICTQKVDKNDDILGFFHRWVKEFSKHYDGVFVLALEVGEHSLPANVEVCSLGKEDSVSHLKYLSRFFRFIWNRRADYNHVFVHMNPEYVVLGGALWRLWGKRIGLWYTHRAINFKLRIATFFSHVVFSASRSSFQLATRKLHILGHGIDTERFSCPEREGLHDPLRIISVGRISAIKGQKTIIEAARILRDRGVAFRLRFIGAPGSTERDAAYADGVRRSVDSYKLSQEVAFVGSIPNSRIVDEYCAADVALNMVPEGGLDKTVIEAMASGCVPITSNGGFRKHLEPYANALVVSEDDPNALANALVALVEKGSPLLLREKLRRTAKEKFDVGPLIANITNLL